MFGLLHAMGKSTDLYSGRTIAKDRIMDTPQDKGVSKKLFMGTMVVQGVFAMAKDAPAEQMFRYAIVVAVVALVFQGLQYMIDRKI